jgi:predicted transglutaminase-like cysteine proteinase
MYTAVKAIAAAGVIVVVSIQPGADAARAPYLGASERLSDRLPGTMFNPYADGMAGVFEPRDFAPEGLSSSFRLEPAVAMVVPEQVQPSSLPKYFAIERFDPEPQAAEPAVVEPLAIAPDLAQPEQPVAPPVADVGKPQPATVPESAPREAFVGPQEPAPQAQQREITPRRRTARAAVRSDLIAFDGPAGAPFAHTRFCLKYPGECRVRKMQFRGGPIELTAARRKDLVRINADVNRSIIGIRVNEPVAQEQWLISPKEGDCNDYAVTKRHKLIAKGWPARALLLAEVVTTWGEHHLVLVVRTRQGDLVADNLNANVRNWTKTSYEWVRVESPVNPLFWSKLKAPQPDVVAMNAPASRL